MGILGLDYNAVFQIAELLSIKIGEKEIKKLKALETTALEEMKNDKRNQTNHHSR